MDEGNVLNCFTDGSKCSRPDETLALAGAGIYCQDMALNKSYHLGAHATVFQAEVYAIQKCAENILQSHDFTVQDKIVINTDSQAAIRAFMNPRITSQVVLAGRRALDDLALFADTTLRWVPGHSNIEGNEAADVLAKAGAMQPRTEHDPKIGIAPAAGKMAVKTWVRNAHVRSWGLDVQCRQAKENMGGKLPLLSVQQSILNLTRVRLRNLVGILTGHCGLNRHLTLIGVKESTMCDECGAEEETAMHFISDCPRYLELRMQVFGNCIIDPRNVPLLSWRNIVTFIARSGRFE